MAPESTFGVRARRWQRRAGPLSWENHAEAKVIARTLGDPNAMTLGDKCRVAEVEIPSN